MEPVPTDLYLTGDLRNVHEHDTNVVVVAHMAARNPGATAAAHLWIDEVSKVYRIKFLTLFNVWTIINHFYNESWLEKWTSASTFRICQTLTEQCIQWVPWCNCHAPSYPSSAVLMERCGSKHSRRHQNNFSAHRGLLWSFFGHKYWPTPAKLGYLVLRFHVRLLASFTLRQSLGWNCLSTGLYPLQSQRLVPCSNILKPLDKDSRLKHDMVKRKDQLGKKSMCTSFRDISRLCCFCACSCPN